MSGQRMTGKQHPVTAALSSFVAESRVSSIPGEVLEMAGQCIGDSVACAIAGSTTEPGKIVTAILNDMGGREESTLLPHDMVPAVIATCGNGYLANVLDLDDTLNGHPGACVIPAALAVGERIGAAGPEVLHATILGYEVATRVGDAILPTPERWDQVSGSATFLALGSAVAAAKLLGLSADGVASAIGLAVANAPVPYIRKFGTLEANGLSWAKNNYGWAAAGGVQAALLASKGFQGSPTALDGPRGFWVMAGSDRCDFDHMLRGLGDSYQILRTSFKPYPCCRYLHGALDAFSTAMSARPEDASISEIQVEGFAHIGRHYMNPRPLTMIDAQYSLPYALAMTALGFVPGPRWFDSDALNDSRVASLASRVRFTASASFEGERAYGARVTIVTRVGRERAEVAFPKGHPANPLTQEALNHKFHSLAEPVLGRAASEALRVRIASIRQLRDTRLLTRGIDAEPERLHHAIASQQGAHQ